MVWRQYIYDPGSLKRNEDGIDESMSMSIYTERRLSCVEKVILISLFY